MSTTLLISIQANVIDHDSLIEKIVGFSFITKKSSYPGILLRIRLPHSKNTAILSNFSIPSSNISLLFISKIIKILCKNTYLIFLIYKIQVNMFLLFKFHFISLYFPLQR